MHVWGVLYRCVALTLLLQLYVYLLPRCTLFGPAVEGLVGEGPSQDTPLSLLFFCCLHR